MKKKPIIIGIVVALLVVVATVLGYFNNRPQKLAGGLKPGTYTATEKGFGGDVTVTVTVGSSKITAVDIKGDNETPTVGGAAIKRLGPAIMKAQSPYVDGISGATVTSNAVRAAAVAALVQAGMEGQASAPAPQAQDAAPAQRKSETLTTDVVVIGAGGAGMTAALHLVDAGKSVILLEKRAIAGGNSNLATAGMNAAETHYQKEQGIDDSVELFYEDTMKGGHDLGVPALVRTLAAKSAAGIDWLDSIGAPLAKISTTGGQSRPRTHAPADGSAVGSYLVAKFLEQLEAKHVDIMYETAATSLLMDGGKVVGVKAEGKDADYTINAKAVILTTGGFGANLDMIAKYRPDLVGTISTNAPGITGDGIVMAQAVGAGLVDMEQIQLHPTVEQSTAALITEGVRGDGGIMVNAQGKRFTNEMGTRDAVSAEELKQDGQYSYVVFDQAIREGRKAIEKYVSRGLTVQADTIEGLAGKLGMDPATLKATLDDWNDVVGGKKQDTFGRTTGMPIPLVKAPYYAIKVAPGIHHTMGGVKINEHAQVETSDGTVIPGFFAAGEVTGGIHGGNRIGGNAVCDFVVFGTIAAESALASLQ